MARDARATRVDASADDGLMRCSPSVSTDLAKAFGVKLSLDDALGMDAREIYAEYRRVQTRHRVLGGAGSFSDKYMPFRRYMVDWLSDTGEELRLEKTTVHTGIAYMEFVLQSFYIPKNRWQLLALACLNIAAKYEEMEEAVPTLRQYSRTINQDISTDLMREWEIFVMNKLSWQLRMATPLHMARYFLGRGVCFDDDCLQGRKIHESVPKYVTKYVDFFAELALQEDAFISAVPNMTAAAIIKCSRQALGFEKPWRSELSLVMEMDESEETRRIAASLWQIFGEKFPGHCAKTDSSPKGVADL